LKSVNLLPNSVLRPATAEAILQCPWPCIPTSLGGVSSHLFEAEVPTPEVHYQKI
jgi:hypothetical protein